MVDVASLNGMQVAVWGPAMWHTIHTLAQNFQPKMRDGYRQFFYQVLPSILPCSHCRTNYPRNAQRAMARMAPPQDPLCCRESCIEFAYLLHDEVNMATSGKPSPPFAEVVRRYESFRSRCSAPQRHRREQGCTEPLPGVPKSRCVMRIVPRDNSVAPCDSIQVDPQVCPWIP